MPTKLLALLLVGLILNLGYVASARAQNEEAVEQAKEAQALSKKENKTSRESQKDYQKSWDRTGCARK